MPPTNVYTVSQVTAYIKSRFTEDLLLNDVWLSGEVSNWRPHSSGHCYFTIKDGDSCMKAVIWRTAAQRLVLPRDGDQVLVHGYISVYEAQGVYQIYVDQVKAAGSGRLWLEFERLRANLEAEGLFAADRKRDIPDLPTRIGIVTSPTGAAIRDILRTIAVRYALAEVIVAPAIVQGDGAPASIVMAIEQMNRWSLEQRAVDVIILARGGGSLEDLWAFNDERVARAIVASQIPVVAGIGHETDFTIADFAADLRAPTPTGAAAQCTPDSDEIREGLRALETAAARQIALHLSVNRSALQNLVNRANRASPARRLANHRLRVDELSRRAALGMTNCVLTRRATLQGLRLQMAALDVARVLARGYAIVTKQDGAIVTSVLQVAAGDVVRVRLADGAFDATVEQSETRETW